MCTWMTAAPAAWHSLAVVTSSSRVTGSGGTADFCDSAPVGATVISVSGPVGLAAPGPGAAPEPGAAPALGAAPAAEPGVAPELCAAPAAEPGVAPAAGVWLVMTRRMPPS